MKYAYIIFIFKATVYVSEISSPKWRGTLGSGAILCLTFGIIYVLTIGALLPSYHGSWKIFSVVCIIPQLIGKYIKCNIL